MPWNGGCRLQLDNLFLDSGDFLAGAQDRETVKRCRGKQQNGAENGGDKVARAEAGICLKTILLRIDKLQHLQNHARSDRDDLQRKHKGRRLVRHGA